MLTLILSGSSGVYSNSRRILPSGFDTDRLKAGELPYVNHRSTLDAIPTLQNRYVDAGWSIESLPPESIRTAGKYTFDENSDAPAEGIEYLQRDRSRP